jgi:hypothetical protein
VCAALALAAGCGSVGKSGATQTATSSVTPAQGGTVTLPDNSAHLDIPAGALTSATMITVSTTDATPPAGITAASPILKFEPDGLVFAKPVTVTFTFANATRPIVYWSNASGGYDPIAGTVTGSTISAQVTHFSSGFVADAPAVAGAAPCGEGVSCTAGAACGYGATASAPMSGASSGASSGGSGAPSGYGTSPGPTAPKTGALCMGSSGTPNAGPGGSNSGGSPASTNPSAGGASGGTVPASVDASTTDGTACGTGAPPTSGGSSMCCSCGSDGTFHCSPCSGSVNGTGGTNSGGPDAGLSGPPTCASGAVCAPGQMCGGADSSGAKTCCTCGADGHFQCGNSMCPGQPPLDGGAAPGGGTCVQGGACVVGGGRCGNASPSSCLMCDCGADGKYVCSPCGSGAPPPPSDGGVPPGDGGAPPPPSDGGPGGGICADGATCMPGSGCKSPSPTGQCLACMCSAGGTLQCSPCGASFDGSAPPPPPPGDGGSTTPPPATCDPGLACPLGYQCGNKTAAGACTLCTCAADGHLACGACPGAPDGGAPPPPPPQDSGASPQPIPPQACVMGGACPQPGQMCSNGLPPGNGCLKCGCGPNMTLMCVSC